MAKTINCAYISGLGAIGGAFGSVIYDSGREFVRVIADEERIARYSENGITVNGRRYDFIYANPQEPCEIADLILIAVKGYDLGASMESIKPFVGENTVIMSLLNGITSEETLARAFGREKILHAFCVGTDALREGTRISYSRIGKIVFGDRYNPGSDNEKAVRDFFDRTKVPYKVPEDIMRELWWKFIMNVGINQTSAILRASYGVYRSVAEARELMMAACHEVLPLARKEGVNLTEDDIRDFLDVIGTLAPEGRTSMLQDVEAGRKTEVESFALTVMELGKKHGISTPVNEVLYRMIRVIEQTYPRKA
jgi:2-dehydropantoate 2-reductase